MSNRNSLRWFQEAPEEVQYLLMCSAMKIPVGASTYDNALKKYPEYFPEEVENRIKWSLVPKEVNDAYFKEWWANHEKIYGEIPNHGKGILYYATHPEEGNEYKHDWFIVREEEKKFEKKLYKKYYAKYGIEYPE